LSVYLPIRSASNSIARRALAQLQEALEAFPLPVVSTDDHGVVVWQNAAAVDRFGDMQDLHYDRVIAPKELPGTRERFTRLMGGRPTHRVRNVVRAMSGELVPVEVTATPLREEGKVVGTLAVAVPLTTRYEPQARPPRLTSRQHDMLVLLVEGRSTNEIAAELHLSPVTVRNYIRTLLRALNAGSRLEAVVTALREGLVSLDPPRRIAEDPPDAD
jgi:PAS domain S-box-containing protein